MKKNLFIAVNLIILLFFSVASAKTNLRFKEGAYLEKNQWGALEDILSDCKSGVISTDECVIYGCNVLAANDDKRIDRLEKQKLIPKKYKINKKSIEEGPYFFIYFIYKNEDYLGPKALNEFRNSDWCDEEFINEIITNNEVDNELQKLYSLPKDEIRKKINRCNDTLDILNYLADNKHISSDALYIVSSMLYDDHKRFNKKFNEFKRKYNLKYLSNSCMFTSMCLLKIKTPKNRKSINIINYRYKYFELIQKYGYDKIWRLPL